MPIGWIVYGDDMFPITRVEMDSGAIILISQVKVDEGAELLVDRNAPCTIMGRDGEQVAHISREGLEPEWGRAANGGYLEIVQLLRIADIYK